MKDPKVLLASPCYQGHEYVIKRFLSRVKNLSYSNYDILLVDNSEGDEFFKFLMGQKIKVIKSPYYKNPFERITVARNAIVNYLLQHDYDYLMSIDTDVIPPKNVIERLLKHKKDLVGMLVHMGFKKKSPCVLKSGHIIKGGMWGLQNYSWNEVKALPQLSKVYATSIACLLVHRKVFESGVKFRYTPVFRVGEDIWFFAECNEKGFQFWLDKKRVKHYNKDRRLICQQNRLNR